IGKLFGRDVGHRACSVLTSVAAAESVATEARQRLEGGRRWVCGGVCSFSSPNQVRRFWLLADPTEAFGKETDLLLDDLLVPLFGNCRLKRFSMVIEDGTVKALNVESDSTGLNCSLAPNILSQL
uniref:Peroxiredoxin 5 n=1 Tax=Sciurus vulgaris TaxID=55149 RepID=A0A8D2JPZ4_SCIVU